MSQVGRSPPVVEQHAASAGAADLKPPPHGSSGLFLRLLRKGEWLPRLVARIPATIHVKLLTAFLTIVVLLIVVGAVGLETLSAVNTRTEELVLLHRKIGAYRQLQHDTTGQLYSVASSLMTPDERALDATLRQLTPTPLAEARYRDTSVEPGKRYIYSVVAVDTQVPLPNISAESERVEETAR